MGVREFDNVAPYADASQRDRRRKAGDPSADDQCAR